MFILKFPEKIFVKEKNNLDFSISIFSLWLTILISLTEIPKGDAKSSKLKLIFLILTLAPGNSLVILLSIYFCTPSKLKIIEDACQIKRNIIIDAIVIAVANILFNHCD